MRVCVCVCARACVSRFFFSRFCVKYLLYINAYVAASASSLQDFAQVIFADVCVLSLAHASSTAPAHAKFRPLSVYRFC